MVAARSQLPAALRASDGVRADPFESEVNGSVPAARAKPAERLRFALQAITRGVGVDVTVFDQEEQPAASDEDASSSRRGAAGPAI